jgi:hypothetical protein
MGRGIRRKPLSRVDQDSIVHRLERVANEIADIGDLIGSVYGAAWCNKALKLQRNIHRLRLEVIDHYDDSYYGKAQGGRHRSAPDDRRVAAADK